MKSKLMKNKKYTQTLLYIIVGIFVLAMTFWAFKYFKDKKPVKAAAEKTEEQHATIEVTTTTVKNQPLTEFLTLNGTTKFQKTANIRSNATGYVLDMGFVVGNFIQKGQLFCRVKTKEQDALKEINLIDTSLRVFNQPLTVVSNASGILSMLNVHVGDYVAEGDILAVLTEPSSLVILVNVPYEYHQTIKVGTKCEVKLPDNRIMNLEIGGMTPSVDAVSQAQFYFIRLPNENLPENLNVILRFPYKQSGSAKSIPINALQTDELQKEFWVMRVVDSIAVKTPVTIGLQTNELVEIKSGNVKIGDEIVLQGGYGLADSTSIAIKKD